jgi:hypothetical protein
LDFSEAFKLIGSASGLGSALVLAYDRVFRSRPLAHLHIQDSGVYLRLKNVVDVTIILYDLETVPKVVSFARANDLKSTIQAAAESVYPSMAEKARDFVIIDPLKERALPLVRLSELKKCDDAQRIVISAKWKLTARPWPFPRRVKVKTCAGDLKRLVSAAEARG